MCLLLHITEQIAVEIEDSLSFIFLAGEDMISGEQLWDEILSLAVSSMKVEEGSVGITFFEPPQPRTKSGDCAF